jgi:hypothetical protein
MLSKKEKYQKKEKTQTYQNKARKNQIKKYKIYYKLRILSSDGIFTIECGSNTSSRKKCKWRLPSRMSSKPVTTVEEGTS